MKVTVNNQDKEEVIDWNKVQLVQATIEPYEIVQVSLAQYIENTSRYFSGTNILNGDYDPSWDKTKFQYFHGSITLQND